MSTTTTSLKITSEIVSITPDIAKKWLETKNISNNRAISLDKAKQYAKAMSNNEWMIGDALKFDMEDMLCDGQHRLKAVILSGKTIDFLVLKGYEPKSAHVLDRGKPRVLANVAQLQGFSWIKPKHTAVFNSLFHPLTNSSRILRNFTDQERINGISALKDSFELSLKRYKNGIRNAVLSAVISRAFYSPKIKNINVLNDFLLLVNDFNYHDNSELFSSKELSPSAPIRLRQMFLTNSWELGLDGEGLQKHQYLYIQNALSHFINNTTVKRLAIKTENLFPVSWIDDLSFNKPD